MNAISGISGRLSAMNPAAKPLESAPTPAELEVKEKFQQFVAGTFFSEMVKTMRKMHDKPAYFHGGRAEEIFQGQLDQGVVDSLAADHGEAFSDPLFSAFSQQMRLSQKLAAASQTGSAANVAASDSDGRTN